MHTDSVRAQAKAQGLKTYQGAPCKRGHAGERYVIQGRCVVCWRERSRKNYAEHPEKQHAYNVAYYEAHREELCAKQAAYYATNREECSAYFAAYVKAHSGAHRASDAKRRALKKSQRCTCCTDAQLAEPHKQAALCGRFAHVDHIIPLELGGAHCVRNLRPMTDVDHIKKTSKIDAGLIAEARRERRAASSEQLPCAA